MASPLKSRRWPRRLAYGLGAMLVLIAVGLWLGLPALVRAGFGRGAKAVGFTEASIQVERADLTGLRATAMLLRMGGLEVRLDQGAADYSVRKLIGGRVTRIEVDGLAASLDFTQARRGLLPDAIGDLLAQMDGGGDLVWPVDELTMKNCRLVLILPGGAQTFVIAGSASRQPDGQIAFEVRSDHPGQALHVSGLVRTETMDGELTLHRLSLQPNFALGLVRQLGLFDLPEDMSLTSEAIEISGAATLRAGVPEIYSGRMRAPLVRATVEGTIIAVDDLDVTAGLAPGGKLSAVVNARLEARGEGSAWHVGPATLQLALDGGDVHGSVASFPFAYGENAQGQLAVEVESGVPLLGGQARARINLAVTDLIGAGLSFAPITVSAEGWTDRAVLQVPLLALAGEQPAALAELAVTASDLAGPARAIEGSVQILAHAAAVKLLPTDVKLVEPVLPATIARVDFRGTVADAGPSGTVVARTTLPRVHVMAGESSVTCKPDVEITAVADPFGVALAAAISADAIEARSPFTIPGLNAGSFALEVPRVSYAALAALADRRLPDEDLALTLKGALVKSAATGEATLTMRRSASAAESTVTANAKFSGVNGDLSGAAVTELGGEASIDSGGIGDARAAEWLRIGDVGAVVRALLPQIELRVSSSAAAIELPGRLRAEWAGARFTKPRAADGAPPLSGSLALNAGIVRSGPETIEQPLIKLEFAGDESAQDVTAAVGALLEGAPLRLTATQHLALDGSAGSARGEGSFVLEPFTLTNSDIISRWDPSLRGVVVSGTLAARGALNFASDGAWDGTAAVELTRGAVNYPAQEVNVEGVFANVAIDSLASLRTAAGQRVGFARLAFGEIVARDGLALFRTENSSVVHIEGVSLRVFDGEVTAEPFSLYFPDPDVALDLRMNHLDAGEVVRTFELFDGTLTGRLRGRLPIGLLAGRPILGEGFLELEEEFPARLSVNTGGLFTVGLPDKTPIDHLNRLPYELLEDGLRGLELRRFRADLFRRDKPDVPVEIVLGGTAHTERADVPLEMTIRINGSVSELIDHILQLVMM